MGEDVRTARNGGSVQRCPDTRPVPHVRSGRAGSRTSRRDPGRAPFEASSPPHGDTPIGQELGYLAVDAILVEGDRMHSGLTELRVHESAPS